MSFFEGAGEFTSGFGEGFADTAKLEFDTLRHPIDALRAEGRREAFSRDMHQSIWNINKDRGIAMPAGLTAEEQREYLFHTSTPDKVASYRQLNAMGRSYDQDYDSTTRATNYRNSFEDALDKGDYKNANQIRMRMEREREIHEAENEKLARVAGIDRWRKAEGHLPTSAKEVGEFLGGVAFFGVAEGGGRPVEDVLERPSAELGRAPKRLDTKELSRMREQGEFVPPKETINDRLFRDSFTNPNKESIVPRGTYIDKIKPKSVSIRERLIKHWGKPNELTRNRLLENLTKNELEGISQSKFNKVRRSNPRFAGNVREYVKRNHAELKPYVDEKVFKPKITLGEEGEALIKGSGIRGIDEYLERNKKVSGKPEDFQTRFNKKLQRAKDGMTEEELAEFNDLLDVDDSELNELQNHGKKGETNKIVEKLRKNIKSLQEKKEGLSPRHQEIIDVEIEKTNKLINEILEMDVHDNYVGASNMLDEMEKDDFNPDNLSQEEIQNFHEALGEIGVDPLEDRIIEQSKDDKLQERLEQLTDQPFEVNIKQSLDDYIEKLNNGEELTYEELAEIQHISEILEGEHRIDKSIIMNAEIDNALEEVFTKGTIGYVTDQYAIVPKEDFWGTDYFGQIPRKKLTIEDIKNRPNNARLTVLQSGRLTDSLRDANETFAEQHALQLEADIENIASKQNPKATPEELEGIKKRVAEAYLYTQERIAKRVGTSSEDLKSMQDMKTNQVIQKLKDTDITLGSVIEAFANTETRKKIFEHMVAGGKLQMKGIGKIFEVKELEDKLSSIQDKAKINRLVEAESADRNIAGESGNLEREVDKLLVEHDEISQGLIDLFRKKKFSELDTKGKIVRAVTKTGETLFKYKYRLLLAIAIYNIVTSLTGNNSIQQSVNKILHGKEKDTKTGTSDKYTEGKTLLNDLTKLADLANKAK